MNKVELQTPIGQLRAVDRSIDGTVLSIIFLIILSNTLAYLFIKVGQSHCLKV